jgi:hypothetical protein
VDGHSRVALGLEVRAPRLVSLEPVATELGVVAVCKKNEIVSDLNWAISKTQIIGKTRTSDLTDITNRKRLTWAMHIDSQAQIQNVDHGWRD